MDVEFATVPRRWPGETVVCIAGGPSLTAADVDACRGRARVIAVNDAYRLAPWADVLYACDWQWWKAHKDGVAAFAGAKYTVMPQARRWAPDVQVLADTGDRGVEDHPTGLRTGRNSGYQAINLALHFGATRILLLGYDMQRGPKGQAHWFGNHPWHWSAPPLSTFVPYFHEFAAALRLRGVTVLNCSRDTALTCFDRSTIDAALACEVAA